MLQVSVGCELARLVDRHELQVAAAQPPQATMTDDVTQPAGSRVSAAQRMEAGECLGERFLNSVFRLGGAVQ